MTAHSFGLGDIAAGTVWPGSLAIPAFFVEGGAAATLEQLGFIGSTFTLVTSGPDLTSAWESYGLAVRLTDADGAAITVAGPSHPSGITTDPREPYFWAPGNQVALLAWFAIDRAGVTLTLDDGVDRPTHDARGTAAAGGAVATGWVRHIPARHVRGRASAGDAAATARVLTALGLAAFDTEGVATDVLALIEAGARPDVFSRPPRGDAGTLLDGEFDLSGDPEAFNAMRWRDQGSGAGSERISLHDNGPLHLRNYFDAGGAGNDLTVRIQTAGGAIAFPVAGNIGAGGGNYVIFNVPAADQAFLAGIAAGDRFIFALARTIGTFEVQGTAAAGDPQASTRLLRVTPAIRAVRGAAAAGAPEASARLARARVLAIRGAASSAPAETSAYVQSTSELAERYARALHDSAPADRLLTALEIEHPAVAQPVRVINDTVNREIEGNDYAALRFDARLADDVDGRAPQAELAIDNVGRELTQWIEAAGGGIGATVRVMLVLDIDDPPVEWEVTLDVAGMSVDQERATARLGFDPLLGRAAVALRHDPQTSPGLF